MRPQCRMWRKLIQELVFLFKKKKKRKVMVTEGREKFFVFLLKIGDKQCC